MSGTATDPGQEVVVSAARIPQKLSDTLPSTVVLTRADIDATPATDLPGLLRAYTSVSVVQNGPLGSATSVFLRGADSRQVQVRIDGAPLARADFGSAPWELIPLDQVERIEIVRGNLSSLYGAQAVGGVVQIFTRGGAGSDFSIAGGNLGQAQASASVGRRLGDAVTPLDLRASVSGQTTDGFSARDPRVDPSANPDIDPARQQAAHLRADKTWAPGQRTTVSLMRSDTRSAYDGYTPGLDDVLKTRLNTASLQSRHALVPGWQLDLDLSQASENFTDPTGFNTRGDARTRIAGTQLEWQFAPGQSLQVQAEERDERYADDNDPERRRRTHSGRLGWVGQSAGGLEWQADLRHDKSGDFGGATTGLAAIGWRFSPMWKASVQGSTAFSAPSFLDQQYAASPTALRPERSRDVELGLQGQGAGWQGRIDLFAQRQHDRLEIVSVPGPVGFEMVNIGHARNRGVELSGEVAAGPGRLGLDATFQNPRDDDTGQPLKRRPRSIAALNYQVPLAGWDTGVWLRYTGPRADVDPVTFADRTAAARTVVGLSVRRALSPVWTLGLKIDNLARDDVPEVLGYTAAPRSIVVQLQGHWK